MAISKLTYHLIFTSVLADNTTISKNGQTSIIVINSTICPHYIHSLVIRGNGQFKVFTPTIAQLASWDYFLYTIDWLMYEICLTLIVSTYINVWVNVKYEH